MRRITKFRGEFAFLSNFSPSIIRFDGFVYSTVEHAYQAAKTLNKLDRALICSAATPTRAKHLGYKVELRPDWDKIKENIMYKILKEKFTDLLLGQLLINTYPARLIEGNDWGDRYWGAELVDGKWIGKNVLGRQLMNIRRGLKV